MVAYRVTSNSILVLQRVAFAGEITIAIAPQGFSGIGWFLMQDY
jgi:hypothetical protein